MVRIEYYDIVIPITGIEGMDIGKALQSVCDKMVLYPSKVAVNSMGMVASFFRKPTEIGFQYWKKIENIVINLKKQLSIMTILIQKKSVFVEKDAFPLEIKCISERISKASISQKEALIKMSQDRSDFESHYKGGKGLADYDDQRMKQAEKAALKRRRKKKKLETIIVEEPFNKKKKGSKYMEGQLVFDVAKLF